MAFGRRCLCPRSCADPKTCRKRVNRNSPANEQTSERTEDGEMVVVQPLSSVRTSWLEPILRLQKPSNLHVSAHRKSARRFPLGASRPAHFQKTRATIALLSLGAITPSFRRHNLCIAPSASPFSKALDRYSQPADKVELHPAPVIDSRPVAPAFAEVDRQLVHV